MARTKEFDPDVAVDAAMELFWTNGYAGTTPQQLVDALGIGRGSLYNAFGSKHALYERALRRYQERETARLIELLDGAGSPRARLRDAVQLVVTAARSDELGRGCMMTNAAAEFGERDEVVNHLVRRAFARQETAFRDAILEGQRAGEIDPAADAGALAALFLATINGIRVLGKADPESDRLAALAETVLRAL